jgi:hypothetical protein
MVPKSTQPVTEMSTRKLPVGKGRPARKVDNLTLSVIRMCRKCGSLDVSQSCGPSRPVTGIDYRDNFTLTLKAMKEFYCVTSSCKLAKHFFFHADGARDD